MRALVRSASILLITVATRCQGIVNFANGAAGVNAPVTMAPDNTPVEGPEWQAELWVQDTNNNWIRASQSVPFLTQAVAGYFLGGSVTVPDVDAGQQATFRVRAFNTNSALEGISKSVTVTLGGGKMPPGKLLGLQAWSIVVRPELTISVSDTSAAVSWSTNFAGFVLESSGNLARANWGPVAQAPTISGARFSVTLRIGSAEMYYRLRSN